MSARCAFVLPTGGPCDAKKTAPVHSHHHPAFHTYLDPSKAGLKAVSEGRQAYMQSETHKEAMALSRDAKDCWPAAYGAPGECFGPISPSHIVSRGAHGGLEVADEYPAPPACQQHNAGMEQDAEIRAWAEVTYFTHGNRQYPFKVTREWLTAERERMAAL